MGSAQRVVVAHARTPHDAAVQYCPVYFGSKHPGFKFEGGHRSVVQFDCVLSETGLRIAYAPVDLDGRVGVVVTPPSRYI